MLNSLRVAAFLAAMCAPALAQFSAFSVNPPQMSGCGRVEINGIVIPSGSAVVTSLT